MTIAYFSNFLNHHQKLVADKMYEFTSHQYVFVETIPMYDWLKEGGYADYSQEPYVLRSWESEDNRQRAVELAKAADVAIFGGPDVLQYEILRARSTNKLSFEVSERWLKRGWINILSPRLLINKWYYHTLFSKRPFYKLCASAFGANDEYKLLSYKNRCYKWGYFTKVEPLDIGLSSHEGRFVKMMWCSRFLDWKHPELPILLAEYLKNKGYEFEIDMYGSGELLERAQWLVSNRAVGDVVKFCGNAPNDQILQAMREHDIFLFTSDQNEGWGAVANEAMSNGCVLVASDAIGAMPFLVNDGINGIAFRSSKKFKGFRKNSLKVDEAALHSLCVKVEYLLNHPEICNTMSIAARETLQGIWSPDNAAKNLLQLINDLQAGNDTTIATGPCSKALPI